MSFWQSEPATAGPHFFRPAGTDLTELVLVVMTTPLHHRVFRFMDHESISLSELHGSWTPLPPLPDCASCHEPAPYPEEGEVPLCSNECEALWMSGN